MKRNLFCLTVVVLLLVAGQVLAQVTRRPQIELYGGAGIPRSPEDFKDYYKIGLSLHGQYVVFPQPNVGITLGGGYEKFSFDGETFISDVEDATGWDLSGVEATGSASILELGVGVRPYLTPQDASTQVFLFGMGTLNFLKSEAEVTGPGGSFGDEESESVIGVAAGAGIEVPAGESLNMVVQGIFKFVFADKVTDGETMSFLGVTAGVVF